MIKNSTYIRRFTPQQKKQLEQVAADQGFKSVPEILFFALDSHLDQKNEIARLNRIIAYKQKKIDKLTGVEILIEN